MSQVSTFNLFLIGPGGGGKSTFCNFLFHEQKFHEKNNLTYIFDEKSKLFNTNTDSVVYDSTTVNLFDSPGFLDHRHPSVEIYNEIREAASHTNPDCFGYVIDFSDRMPASEYHDLHTMINTFGDGVWDHMFAIFTHEDKCTKDFPGQTGREFVQSILDRPDNPSALKFLMPKINKRYMIVENKQRGNTEDHWNAVFTELIALMNEVRELNRGFPFDGKQMESRMDVHVELERESEQRNEERYALLRKTAKEFYAANAPNKDLPPHLPQTARDINQCNVFPLVMASLKDFLKDFWKSHPSFVIAFIFTTTSLSLYLCYDFVCKELNPKPKSWNFLSILKWITPKFLSYK